MSFLIKLTWFVWLCALFMELLKQQIIDAKLEEREREKKRKQPNQSSL